MANKEHLEILKQGVETWNKWREQNQRVRPDLSSADLSGMNLRNANLFWAFLFLADLRNADLTQANLRQSYVSQGAVTEAILTEADLTWADLHGADLRQANFTNAHLRETDLQVTSLCGATFLEADLGSADLRGADLRGADLRNAYLCEAVLNHADLREANLSGCRIFGISTWKVKLEDAIQSDLIITDDKEPVVTVDNLETAQFIHLLLHNEKLRDVIDTVGKKAVLILGSFSVPERKAILEALKEQLRKQNYIPILFDFEKPSNRDLDETIVTLAHLSRFIIADITSAKSIAQELRAIVPNLPSVAVQPIIHKADYEYAMFEHFRHYPWVLPVYQYETQEQLLAVLSDKVIHPAEKKIREIRRNR